MVTPTHTTVRSGASEKLCSRVHRRSTYHPAGHHPTGRPSTTLHEPQSTKALISTDRGGRGGLQTIKRSSSKLLILSPPSNVNLSSAINCIYPGGHGE
jgi:hypothetical protein